MADISAVSGKKIHHPHEHIILGKHYHEKHDKKYNDKEKSGKEKHHVGEEKKIDKSTQQESSAQDIAEKVRAQIRFAQRSPQGLPRSCAQEKPEGKSDAAGYQCSGPVCGAHAIHERGKIGR
ncbi:MAG TPA: hypothetical protein H9857_05280 [Candidatus Desulfovibrio intestinigallinarum]|nr:hypothetical protein [Candidatus Desulfovibrio intestinigallinarum]